MKREVVIQVTMKCQKCRIKAFKDVSKAPGVETIKIDGDKKDQLTVIGEEIDSVCLAASLRKKFCCVNIVKVITGNEKKEEKKEEKWQPPLPPCYYIERCPYQCYVEPCPYQCYVEPIGPGCNIFFVDPSSLRKIFGYADLVSVNPAEGKQEEKEQKEVKEAKEVKKMEWRWQPPLYQHHYIEPGPFQYYNEPIGPFCSIM